MKSFNKITKGLRKTISQLEGLMNYNQQESQALKVKITTYELSINELETEGIRAWDTATKLKTLIGD